MRSSIAAFLILLGLASAPTPVLAADQRVLLSFDNAGHQVRQVVRPTVYQGSFLAEKNAEKNSHEPKTHKPDVDLLASQQLPGTALLLWLDDEGYLHARTDESDPRVSHAPAHINSSAGSRQGNLSGAWLVTGPASATSLKIFLASDPALGLAAEQWHISLVGW